MSIFLNISLFKSHEVTSTQGKKPKSSSILLLSAGLILVVLLVMYGGISYTEGVMVMKQYSACRDKIIAYEKQGFHTGSEEFKLALSFCDMK